MNITDVNIKLTKSKEKKLKAIASIVIDNCFAIHDIKVIQSNQRSFISMPAKKSYTGEYRDIVHPLNSETREYISTMIMQEYEKALSEYEKSEHIDDDAD